MRDGPFFSDAKYCGGSASCANLSLSTDLHTEEEENKIFDQLAEESEYLVVPKLSSAKWLI